jgi:hypothetical protein
MSKRKEMVIDTDRNPYREAIGITHGASNSLGITRSLAAVMVGVIDDMTERGEEFSTREVNRAPVMVLILEQLIMLCGGYITWDDNYHRYSRALRECEERAIDWDKRHPPNEEVGTESGPNSPKPNSDPAVGSSSI